MVSISKILNNGLLLVGQSVYSDVATPQQASVEQYNIINFLGGAGPYKQYPGFGISTDIPSGCQLQHVQMLSRHGERFPTQSKGKLFEEIMEVFHNYSQPFQGDLAFLNDYTYFVSDKSNYEKETTPANSNGPYAGVVDAYRHGAYFRTRYGSLYLSNQTLPVFTSNSGRCYETSRYFAQGFLGGDLDKAKFVVIDEDGKMGVNSLTPRYACKTYNPETDKLDEYDTSYLEKIRDRLVKQNPGLELTTDHISGLFSWCPYEINVKGSSPVCSLFTNDEFIRDGYYNDLEKYYTKGPGNPITKTIASPLLQASLKLIKQHQDDQEEPSIYVSFAHDTDIEIFLSTLGLIGPDEDLPTDRIPFPNPYNMADILPQAARLYTENYKCSDGDSYVRYILNDAVIPLDGCQNGPGFSCSLSDFESYVDNAVSGLDYKDQCDLQPGSPDTLSFYWDYNSVDYNATIIQE